MLIEFKILLLVAYSISSAIGLSLLKYFPVFSVQGLFGVFFIEELFYVGLPT